MKTVIAILLWFILLALCWPLALVVGVFLLIGGIFLLPFAIAGFTIGLVFKIIGAILLFPFKVLRAI